MTACTTTNWPGDSSLKSVEKRDSNDYFYNYGSLIKSLQTQKTLTSEEFYILGEYFFFRGEFHTSEKYLLHAMESTDERVVFASFILFRNLFASYSLAEGMAKIRPQTTNPKILRYLLRDSVAWALALGDSHQATNQLKQLNPMNQCRFYRESYLNSSSDSAAQSSIEQNYVKKEKIVAKSEQTIILPSNRAEISLENYTTVNSGEIYYLHSDFFVARKKKKRDFTVFVETEMSYRLYIDGVVVKEQLFGGFKTENESDLYLPMSCASGRHSLLLKVMPQRGDNTDISLFFIDNVKHDSHLSWRLPTHSNTHTASSQKRPLFSSRKQGDIFNAYLDLIGKSFEYGAYSSQLWMQFYSRVMGSDNPALLWRLAEIAIGEKQRLTAQKLFDTALSREGKMDYIRMRYSDVLLAHTYADSVHILFRKDSEKKTIPYRILEGDYLREKGWLTLYNQAIQQMQHDFPDYVITSLYGADNRELRGDKKGDIRVKEGILNRLPGYLPIASGLLEQYEKDGDLDRVISFTTSLLSIYPEIASYHMARADARYARKLYSDAYKDYVQVLKLNPTSVESLIKLGDIAVELGDYSDALNRYLSARSIAPNIVAISEKLEQLDALRSPPNLTSYLLSQEAVDRLKKESLTSFCEEDIQVIVDEGIQEFTTVSSYHAIYRVILRVLTKEGARKLSIIPVKRRVLSATLTKANGTVSDDWSHELVALSFGNLSVGDVIEYTVKDYGMPQRWIEGVDIEWLFGQQGRCVEKSILTMRYPENLAIQTYRQGAVKKIKESVTKGLKQVVFEVDQTVFSETDEPSLLFRDVVPLVAITSVPSWDVVAEWALSLIRDEALPSTPIVKKAQLLYGKGSVLAFINNAYRFVADEIRYKPTYEEGLRAKPVRADLLLRRREGSYSDRVNLLKSLLTSGGVTSFFVLTKREKDGAVFTTMPAMQFSHTLLWIPPQKGVDTGFFIDFSPEKGVPGLISVTLEGKTGLLLDDDEGKWRFVLLHSLVEKKKGIIF